MKVNKYTNSASVLKELFLENDGIVTTSQAIAAGVSKPTFYKYIQEENIEQVSHGVYATPDAWVDPMLIISKRAPNAVFSHDTALFLHGLTDREPLQLDITVCAGYNATGLKQAGVRIHTTKAELHSVGISNTQNSFQSTVRVYDMERTICDMVKSRNQADLQVFRDAFQNYSKRPDKNLATLMKYAKILRVEKPIRQYLEVLL